MHFFNLQNSKKGFTLIEMLIAVSLFVIIVFVSLGALLAIFDANRKAQSARTVMDNLNLAVEDMARTIRFGSKFYCGVIGNTSDLTSVNDCSEGEAVSVVFNGARITYRKNGDTIEKRGGGETFDSIISPDTKIQTLTFKVVGSSNSDVLQPYVVVVMKGYVGSRPSIQTSFSIETMMSQRSLDTPPNP